MASNNQSIRQLADAIFDIDRRLTGVERTPKITSPSPLASSQTVPTAQPLYVVLFLRLRMVLTLRETRVLYVHPGQEPSVTTQLSRLILKPLRYWWMG